jgi:hypothetical protein
VWELDGPTPIFNMSKTEIHSSIKVALCSKYNGMIVENEKNSF